MSEALVYTKHGNLPEASLRRAVTWHFTPNSIVHREVYWRGDEIVKESADVYILPEGMVFNMAQGQLGG
jgi:hypothetical protein